MAGTFEPDEDPPAYSEIAPPQANSRFPTELNLYFPSGSFFLGLSVTQPLYSLSVDHRQFTPPEVEIVLRAGPDRESPTLATLNIRGNDVRIWAPKQAEVDLSPFSISTFPPTGRLGTGYGTYVFTVPVLGSDQSEEYAWTHSSVPDILQVKTHWTLSRKQSGNDASGSGSRPSGAPRARDETVATLSFKKDSRSKIGTIKFEGSGATGELGDRWALVTILTALAVWQHKPGAR
ncbi:hypothetical protein F4777DRAFT_118075 [Nemania sp. FL0916]|nr:hypothetical protein F4777DRAFT_118075 [Nemania sp. FL0916]